MYKQYILEIVKYFLRSQVLITKYKKEIEELYRMNPLKLEERNQAIFLNIFRRAYTKSSFYHKLYNNHNIGIDDIRGTEDICKLPVVEKFIIRDVVDDLITHPNKFLLFKAHTSGSTGSPLTLYRDYAAILKEEAYLSVFKERRGIKKNDRRISLRGNLNKDIGFLEVKPINTLFLSSYCISEQTYEEYYNLIQNYKPKYIEGYPSSLYNLAVLLRENNLKLNIPICFTSSETLFRPQRKLIEDTFNSQIYDFYGVAERTVALGETIEHDGYFSFPGYSINEFQDNGVISTSLINYSFPLIRYKVNDIISLKKNPNWVNNEYCQIESLEGRTDDVVITKDGTKISRLGFLFSNIKGLDVSQIHQYKEGFIEIKIVVNSSFSEEEKDKLIKNIDSRIGLNNIDFEINEVTPMDMYYTERNKLKFIVNHIK